MGPPGTGAFIQPTVSYIHVSKGQEEQTGGEGKGNKGKVTGVRGRVGVMRGRKHSHAWGMSCCHLSQHPGPPPSGSPDSCGFLKQHEQLPGSPFSSAAVCDSPLTPLSTFPRTVLIPGNPTSKTQKLRLEEVTPEAQPVHHIANQAPPLKTPPTSCPQYCRKRGSTAYFQSPQPHMGNTTRTSLPVAGTNVT